MATGAIITTLVENTVNIQGLRAEHGLSFLIRIGGDKLLFDTGASDLVIENARRMGLEVADVDAVVLSHGHYDHTGGVAAVLGIAPQAEIHVHPDALAPKFTRQADGTSRYIGMPPAVLEALTKAGSRVCRSTQPREIRPGLFTTGTIPRVTDFEDTGGRFYLDPEGKNADLLLDEQSLYLDMPQGLVVLLGCGHPGVINTLMHIRKLANERPIHSVIGGMHLLAAKADRLARTLEELSAFQIQRLVPMHCTGAWPSARLWNAFETRCAIGPVGTSLAL